MAANEKNCQGTASATEVVFRREPPNLFGGGALKRDEKGSPSSTRFSAGHRQRRLRRERQSSPAEYPLRWKCHLWGSFRVE
jgi:hypothetical protein